MKKILFLMALLGSAALTATAQQTKFTDLFREIQPKEIKGDVFTRTFDDWSVVTAGPKDSFNSMVASWGGWGILMSKPVAWLFLSADRYTLEKIRESKTYTLTYFPDGYKDQLLEFGNKSGRDTDKMRQTKLHPIATPSGTMAYEEANLIIELQLEEITTVNSRDFQSEESQKFTEERFQAVGDYHKIVVGYITHVWEKKD